MNQHDQIIAELERLLELLEKEIDICDRGLSKVDNVQNVIKQVDQKIDEILPHDSVTYRIFDSMQEQDRGYRARLPLSKYATSENCKEIKKRIQAVQSILNEYEPEFLRRERTEKNQYYVPAGEVYRAKALVLKIMKRAQRNLSVVDQYFDEEIFEYVESLDPAVDVKLLTGNQKPSFKTLYYAFKMKRSNVEAKESHSCHDRFLVIDDSQVWHLGCSINGLGKKAFMINKVADLSEHKRLLTDFNDWWANGALV